MSLQNELRENAASLVEFQYLGPLPKRAIELERQAADEIDRLARCCAEMQNVLEERPQGHNDACSRHFGHSCDCWQSRVEQALSLDPGKDWVKKSELDDAEKECERLRLLVPTTAQSMMYEQLLHKKNEVEAEFSAAKNEVFALNQTVIVLNGELDVANARVKELETFLANRENTLKQQGKSWVKAKTDLDATNARIAELETVLREIRDYPVSSMSEVDAAAMQEFARAAMKGAA